MSYQPAARTITSQHVDWEKMGAEQGISWHHIHLDALQKPARPHVPMHLQNFMSLRADTRLFDWHAIIIGSRASAGHANFKILPARQASHLMTRRPAHHTFSAARDMIIVHPQLDRHDHETSCRAQSRTRPRTGIVGFEPRRYEASLPRELDSFFKLDVSAEDYFQADSHVCV